MPTNPLKPTILRAKETFTILPSVLLLLTLLVVFINLAYFTIVPKKIHGLGMLLFSGELSHVLSPETGVVTKWFKEEGDSIKKHDVLALVFNPKTVASIEVRAGKDGVIAEIIAYGNTEIQQGQPLAIISEQGDPRHDLLLTGFVSSLDGKKIKAGMKANVDPTITNPYLHGHLRATVKRVGKLPITKAAILSLLKIPEVAEYIRSQIDAEPFVVVLQLDKDQNHPSGYAWTGPGPKMLLDSGIFAHFNVVVLEQRLLFLMWPQFAFFQAESVQ